MSAVMDRIASAPVLSDEDRARAEHYAVFSRLFASAPDADFLARLRIAAHPVLRAEQCHQLQVRVFGQQVDAAAQLAINPGGIGDQANALAT